MSSTYYPALASAIKPQPTTNQSKPDQPPTPPPSSPSHTPRLPQLLHKRSSSTSISYFNSPPSSHSSDRDHPNRTPRALSKDYFPLHPNPPSSSYSEPPALRVSSRNDLFSTDWSSSAGPNVSSSWIARPVASVAEVDTPRPLGSGWAGQREGWQVGARAAPSGPVVSKNNLTAPSPVIPPPSLGPAPASRAAIDRRRPKIQLALPPSPPSPIATGLGLSSVSTSSNPSTVTHAETLPATPTSPDFRLPGPSSGAEQVDKVWPTVGGGRGPTKRVRMQPSPEWLLGEGRHADVYLAAFTEDAEPSARAQWQLCAAKRLYADRESQLAGLGEAVVLSKLAAPQGPTAGSALSSYAERGAPHVLKLYGVQDELDGLEAVPQVAGSVHGSEGGLSRKGSARYAGLGHGRVSSGSNQASISRAVTQAFPIGAATTSKHRPRHSVPLLSTTIPTSASDTHLQSHFSSALRSTSHSSIDTLQADEDAIAFQSQPAPAPGRILLLLEHCPLGHLLSFAKAYPDRLGRAQWLDWAIQLAHAVAWTHERGVLHADLKPQNVLIAADMSLRLADFGMAVFIPAPGDAPLTDPLGLGTAAYSPPEFVRPPPSAFGLEADVFSLGVTLSVLLSGREPYEGMRAVERMWWVGRGSYWEWEERRRINAIGASRVEEEEARSDYSRPVSRAGSVRSTRSRAGSGGWELLGRRESSVESEAGGVRGAVALARRAVRLVVPGDGGEDEDEVDRRGQDSIEERPPWAAPLLAFPVAPPPLPAPSDAASSPKSSEPGSPELARSAGSVGSFGSGWSGRSAAAAGYPDGSPVQRFLDGREVVPWEVREVLRRMCGVEREGRPGIGEVVRVLEEVRERVEREGKGEED